MDVKHGPLRCDGAGLTSCTRSAVSLMIDCAPTVKTEERPSSKMQAACTDSDMVNVNGVPQQAPLEESVMMCCNLVPVYKPLLRSVYTIAPGFLLSGKLRLNKVGGRDPKLPLRLLSGSMSMS